MKVLSMGWGVQTWTLPAMMALDAIPKVDFIVHADTGHEHQATYDFARQWTRWLSVEGFEVQTVRGGRTDVVREDWSNSVLIPAFSLDAEGNAGQVRRQCTHDWKVMPIRRFIREELARRKIKRAPGIVEMLMGISWDEASARMRDSDVAYITNEYPLVDLRMTRRDCLLWLERHNLPAPPKSACTFCPYSSKANWGALKRDGGPDWQEAVAVDEAIREKRAPHHTLYIHPARKPLSEAVSIPEDEGAKQMELVETPCDSGYCFT